MLSSASFASFFRSYLQSNCSHVSPLALALCTRSRRILIVVPVGPIQDLRFLFLVQDAEGIRTDMYRRGHPSVHGWGRGLATSLHLPLGMGRGAFSSVAYLGCRGDGICERRAAFRVKYVKSSPVCRYWNLWLTWLAVAMLLGPKLIPLDKWRVHLNCHPREFLSNVRGTPGPYHHVGCDVKQCVFLRYL